MVRAWPCFATVVLFVTLVAVTMLTFYDLDQRTTLDTLTNQLNELMDNMGSEKAILRDLAALNDSYNFEVTRSETMAKIQGAFSRQLKEKQREIDNFSLLLSQTEQVRRLLGIPPKPFPPLNIDEQETMAMISQLQFRGTPIVVWAGDLHPALIADIRALWEAYLPLQFKWIDQSISVYCKYFGTCATDLKVLNWESTYANGTSREIHEDFYHAYLTDPLMRSVDVFLCTHPARFCAYYQPFNKTIVSFHGQSLKFITGSPRFYPPTQQWLRSYVSMCSMPSNVCATGSWWLEREARAITGYAPLVIPNTALYAKGQYNPLPEYSQVLLQSRLTVPTPCVSVEKYSTVCARHGWRMDVAEEGSYGPVHANGYQALANYRAVFFVPYMPSTLTFLEYYKMGIPIIAPSLPLLSPLVFENSNCMGHVLCCHAGNAEHLRNREPYGDTDPYASDIVQLRDNLSLSDVYTYPHVLYFDDEASFIRILDETNFTAVSERMLAHNQNLVHYAAKQWKHLLARALTVPVARNEWYSTYDQAMQWYNQQSLLDQ